MARVRVVIRIMCTECDSIISACAQCGNPFIDNQKIHCIKDGILHVCKQCEIS